MSRPDKKPNTVPYRIRTASGFIQGLRIYSVVPDQEVSRVQPLFCVCPRTQQASVGDRASSCFGACLVIAAQAPQLCFAGAPRDMGALAGCRFLLLDGAPQLQELLLHLQCRCMPSHCKPATATAAGSSSMLEGFDAQLAVHILFMGRRCTQSFRRIMFNSAVDVCPGDEYSEAPWAHASGRAMETRSAVCKFD